MSSFLKRRTLNSSLANQGAAVSEPAPPSGVAAPAKSNSDFLPRTIFSLLMGFGFIALVAQGVGTLMPLILFVMVCMFNEIVSINQKARKDRQLHYFRILPYYWLCVTLTCIALISAKEPILNTFPQTIVIYQSFWLFTFSLFMVGFVGFVLSLRQGMYRYQFNQFTWIVMTLVFIVAQGSLQIFNMMQGMIWFLLPATCVVINDIAAYGFGKCYGRTKLLKLSPKKTLEGFAGACVFTMVWGFWFAGFCAKFQRLTCPKKDFVSAMECPVDPLFVFTSIEFPEWVSSLTFGTFRSIEVCPVQYHALAIGAYASLIAPFGGFFASGLKRAFKLKDFGVLIPGHGGMTDRMDCQIITGMFTFVYLGWMRSSPALCPDVDTIVQCALSLAPSDREALVAKLAQSLNLSFAPGS